MAKSLAMMGDLLVLAVVGGVVIDQIIDLLFLGPLFLDFLFTEIGISSFDRMDYSCGSSPSNFFIVY